MNSNLNSKKQNKPKDYVVFDSENGEIIEFVVGVRLAKDASSRLNAAHSSIGRFSFRLRYA